MTRAALALVLAASACGPAGESYYDAACTPKTLYLNRTGGEFTYGPVDSAAMNVSPLVDTTRTLSPWPHDDIDWASLTACIRQGLAPFPIAITETDPGPTTPHAELVFTTAYWATPSAATYIASAACRTTELAFFFGNSLPTYARACHLAVRTYAQMTAQLDLADDCEDFMNNQADCSEMRTFKDELSTCIDDAAAPTECRCGGSTQNSYASLLAATSCP